jgi:hypothetical protein
MVVHRFSYNMSADVTVEGVTLPYVRFWSVTSGPRCVVNNVHVMLPALHNYDILYVTETTTITDIPDKTRIRVTCSASRNACFM